MIWPGEACDKASGMPQHGTQRALWWRSGRAAGSGCAACAPNPVLTQDTILSHRLGELFMNIVHEYSSLGFQNKK